MHYEESSNKSDLPHERARVGHRGHLAAAQSIQLNGIYFILYLQSEMEVLCSYIQLRSLNIFT